MTRAEKIQLAIAIALAAAAILATVLMAWATAHFAAKYW